MATEANKTRDIHSDFEQHITWWPSKLYISAKKQDINQNITPGL